MDISENLRELGMNLIFEEIEKLQKRVHDLEARVDLLEEIPEEEEEHDTGISVIDLGF